MLGIFLGLQTIILILKCWGGQAKKQKKKNVSNTIIQLCVVSFLSNFCLFLLCCFLLFSLVPVFMFLPLLINLSCDACKPPFQFRRTQIKHWFQSQSRVIYMFQMSLCHLILNISKQSYMSGGEFVMLELFSSCSFLFAFNGWRQRWRSAISHKQIFIWIWNMSWTKYVVSLKLHLGMELILLITHFIMSDWEFTAAGFIFTVGKEIVFDVQPEPTTNFKFVI